ncbi:hypothetical protein DPEC_G00079940 [Dallia pectoralis]|uniref:Uncharacterized protein n=1 Tax=Dallia pectoralis TaxID=75939 RepID=A0ACC2H5S5_DALPE|nr:hypothetical protein DPEC_G00079940 [Dallia pectoralis]
MSQPLHIKIKDIRTKTCLFQQCSRGPVPALGFQVLALFSRGTGVPSVSRQQGSRNRGLGKGRRGPGPVLPQRTANRGAFKRDGFCPARL